MSDLVCIGFASFPIRTGILREIDGRDRDQLVSEVNLETCFKEDFPVSPRVRVIGYSVTASEEVHGGIAYSGPPVGFLRRGRNLLYLRRTRTPNEFDMAVPIYETAIRLADVRPRYPSGASQLSVRSALMYEFEAALVQFDANDVSDVERIFDLLGRPGAISELSQPFRRVPEPVQRDIAVALLNHDVLAYETLVISLLMDRSATEWKRENAAAALGGHGTERAMPYLEQVISELATTDDLKRLHNWASDAIWHLKNRTRKCQDLLR